MIRKDRLSNTNKQLKEVDTEARKRNKQMDQGKGWAEERGRSSSTTAGRRKDEGKKKGEKVPCMTGKTMWWMNGSHQKAACAGQGLC